LIKPFTTQGSRRDLLTTYLIVDVDVKDRGMEEFCKYTNSFGVVPTLTVSTPSGGLHLYFNYNSKNPADDQKIKSYLRTKTRFRGVGIDVRGEGGYIVAPPSVINKRAYQIVNSTGVIDIPSQLIDWLLESLPRGTAPPTEPTISKEDKKPTKANKPTVAEPTISKENKKPTKEQMDDMRALCCCLSVAQLDDYHFG
jgi:hypothetical protein